MKSVFVFTSIFLCHKYGSNTYETTMHKCMPSKKSLDQFWMEKNSFAKKRIRFYTYALMKS